MGATDAERKYLAKQKRRRGLQKTRFYCQVCERQCLDENGFTCHIKSEVHMRNLKKELQQKGGSRQLIDRYSDDFVDQFTSLLRRTHGEKLVGLNRFYQEYIKDREHVHLNSTRWKTITALARHLQTSGRCRVVEVPGDGVANAEKFLIASVKPQTPVVPHNNNNNNNKDDADDDVPVDEPLEYIDADRPDPPSRLPSRLPTIPVPPLEPPTPTAPLSSRKTKVLFSLSKKKRQQPRT